MILTYIFSLSGLAIAVLVGAKMWEDRRKEKVFLLKAISRGDKRVREWYHEAAHFYTDSKEKSYRYVTKRLPLEAKIASNKAAALAKQRIEKYIGDIRNSKLLKRHDGISEFFKNVAETEKGTGEIHDSFDDSQEF